MSNSNNKYKTLVSNTMLISLGTFGSKLLVFFMVRFYTSYLTPADYGGLLYTSPSPRDTR